MKSELHEQWMKRAIELSLENVRSGKGGPFGAIIVRDGAIVGEGANQVTSTMDPTAHAEVVAIRNASRSLKTFNLSDCVIYTSCEPCPMCLSAIYWSRIKTIYYGNTKDDAAHINFDDAFIYQELEKPKHQRALPLIQMSRDQALVAFEEWQKSLVKIHY